MYSRTTSSACTVGPLDFCDAEYYPPYQGPDHCIGWDDFQKLVLPMLTADDTVVFILEGKYKEEVDSTEQLCKQLKSKSITTVLLCLPLGDGQDVSGMKRVSYSSICYCVQLPHTQLTTCIFIQCGVLYFSTQLFL